MLKNTALLVFDGFPKMSIHTFAILALIYIILPNRIIARYIQQSLETLLRLQEGRQLLAEV